MAQLNTSDDIATRKRMLFRLPGQLLLALGPGGDESRPEMDALGSDFVRLYIGSSDDVQVGDMESKVMWLDLRLL